jgi:hypothetical protein
MRWRQQDPEARSEDGGRKIQRQDREMEAARSGDRIMKWRQEDQEIGS